MNIAIVNGSFKKNGVTSAILKEIGKEMLGRENVTVNYINLSEYNPAYCTGCTSCYSKGTCPLDAKDNFNEIRGIIKNADGVVLGSPNYVSSVPGIFKTFIDRMNFVTGQALHNKYVFIVTTYQQVRGSRVSKYLKEQSILAGGRVRGRLVVKKDPYDIPVSVDGDKLRIKKAVDKFHMHIKRKSKKNLVEKLFTKVLIFVYWKTLRGPNRKHFTALLNNWGEKGLIKPGER